MYTRYRLLFFLIAILVIWKGFSLYKITINIEEAEEDEVEGKNENAKTRAKVKVSVYYEALCPDSKFFIIYQLLPVYEELKEVIDVDLVPYGKAKTLKVNGETIFYCQHDEVECFANKVHACVINAVADPETRLKYIACMITDNIIPDEAGEKCGREAGVNYRPIGECATDDEGSALLAKHGDRTNLLKPLMSFVPTIELDGSQSTVPQAAILKNLLKSVCQQLENKPKKCLNGIFY